MPILILQILRLVEGLKRRYCAILEKHQSEILYGNPSNKKSKVAAITPKILGFFDISTSKKRRSSMLMS
jgi:hypothetical protein